MAVNVHLGASKMKLTFSRGVDGEGNEIQKTKTYSNVKPDATDEDVYAVADLFIGLQVDPVVAIGRIDEKEITQA
jgi:alcohol dehydrogenase class IV